MLVALAVVVAALFGTSGIVFSQARPPKVTTVRLYIFEHGYLRGWTPDNVRQTFGPEFDVSKMSHSLDMIAPAHVIVHPKGTLIWESGLPDSMMTSPPEVTASGLKYEAPRKSLPDQLATIGYKPEDIMYNAFSHYHSDHSGNSHLFPGATWLVRKTERDFIFSDKPGQNRSHLNALKNSKTVEIETEQYDVFGDGTVVLMQADGHTPGQQVLLLKLAKTGPVILAGDLYHFAEERPPLNWFPKEPQQSRDSRSRVEAYVKKTGSEVWIDHDSDSYAKRKKAPEYYE